jgi:hypothetical protein
MTVSRKNKRPIRVGGEEYLWWVGDDDPNHSGSAATSLRVVSESGDLYIKYHLGQPCDVRHVEVIGHKFRAVKDCGKTHRRFLCPAFEELGIVAPKNVAALITWSIEPGDAPLEVDWRGVPLSEPTSPNPSLQPTAYGGG